MSTPPANGRRERKRAATRQAIADAALRLFLERGYDKVSVRDVAEAADVSTSTLFMHFPGKEALVFDQEADKEAKLVAAVRERAPGHSIIAALRDHVLTSWLPIATDPRLSEYTDLVNSTPALRQYSQRMWTRHTDALAAAIAAETGADPDDLACVSLARFVLEIPAITAGRPDLHTAVDRLFNLLEKGWRL